MASLMTTMTKRGTDSYAKAGEIADEVLTSIRTVVSMSDEKAANKRYFEEGDVVLRRGWRGTLKRVAWYFEEGGVVF